MGFHRSYKAQETLRKLLSKIELLSDSSPNVDTRFDESAAAGGTGRFTIKIRPSFEGSWSDGRSRRGSLEGSGPQMVDNGQAFIDCLKETMDRVGLEYEIDEHAPWPDRKNWEIRVDATLANTELFKKASKTLERRLRQIRPHPDDLQSLVMELVSLATDRVGDSDNAAGKAYINSLIGAAPAAVEAYRRREKEQEREERRGERRTRGR